MKQSILTNGQVQDVVFEDLIKYMQTGAMIWLLSWVATAGPSYVVFDQPNMLDVVQTRSYR